MPDKEVTGIRTKNGSVLLIKVDQKDAAYLQNIFEFIQYSVEAFNNAKALQEGLAGQDENCVAVLFGAGIEGDERAKLLEAIGEAEYSPAAIQIGTEHVEAHRASEGAPSLWEISPCPAVTIPW